MNQYKMLTEREKIIFLTLLTHYIYHSEPVGSRTLSKILDIDLSPATIRNIMADLEDKGFLTHPHTSAGRVPTETGYRYFVDHILECLQKETGPMKSQKHLEFILTRIKERALMLSKISSILSDLSRYVGIVMAPKVSQLTLKHIDFVNMGGHQCMAIFVSESGLIFTRMIETEDVIPQEQLDKMFMPFFTTKGSKGSGLGLAIIKKHVHEHGGQISVDSSPGKGTNFIITLPYQPPHNLAKEEE